MPIYDQTPAHSFLRMLDPKNGLAPGSASTLFNDSRCHSRRVTEEASNPGLSEPETVARLFPVVSFPSLRRERHFALVVGDYLASGSNAWRVASRVLISDSLGSFWMIGSMIHPSPVGTSRVSEIARHSTNVPPSLSWNRQ